MFEHEGADPLLVPLMSDDEVDALMNALGPCDAGPPSVTEAVVLPGAGCDFGARRLPPQGM